MVKLYLKKKQNKTQIPPPPPPKKRKEKKAQKNIWNEWMKVDKNYGEVYGHKIYIFNSRGQRLLLRPIILYTDEKQVS